MTEIRQEETAAARNAEFFAKDGYGEKVAVLDTYKMIRKCVNAELEGTELLLDVGNGGVFEYDTTLVGKVVAIDLMLSQLPPEQFPENVTPRDGNALSLDGEADDTYDAVLQSFLFHHLVGDTPQALIDNIRGAVSEAARVVKPGGRVIIIESCVPRWFYGFEKVAFRPLVAASKTPLLGGHPATLQLPLDDLVALVGESVTVTRAEPLPIGRWITQFGRKWPNALTPARPYILVATKGAGAAG